MHSRPLARTVLVTLFVLLGLAGLTQPAGAAVPADKVAVFTGWTQTSASSYSAWYSARQNQAAWTAYRFNWTTDYCSASPDNRSGSRSTCPAPGTTSATATPRSSPSSPR